MSQNNPNHNEIVARTTGVIGKHYCKSYHNLAKMAFMKKHKRKPTLDDAQELRDIFEAQWYDYYVGKPIRVKANREKGKPIWQYGCQFKIDVYSSMCRFLEYKYSSFVETPDRTDYWLNKFANKKGYYAKSAGDLMKEMNIEFMETHIMDNNLFGEYKQFVYNNSKTLDPYYKRTYTDYSHLAYNGVTDDF